jgi:hypothetical protein
VDAGGRVRWPLERELSFLENELARLAALRTGKYLSVAGLAEVIDTALEEKKDRIQHLTARRDLPKGRLARVRPIAAELATGRYGKFSRGVLSAAKDLFAVR